jgi:hypothetical protein
MPSKMPVKKNLILALTQPAQEQQDFSPRGRESAYQTVRRREATSASIIHTYSRRLLYDDGTMAIRKKDIAEELGVSLATVPTLLDQRVSLKESSLSGEQPANILHDSCTDRSPRPSI